MRLDKRIANSTDYSRSEVKKALRSCDVYVNGVCANSPAQQVSTDDDIKIFGNLLRAQGYRYFMLNKPLNCVSANKDHRHPTVLDCIDEDNHQNLHIAGRLDIDTTGLVLITDDGQWTHRTISPIRDCQKCYRVGVNEPVSEEDIKVFAEGIFLSGEKKCCRPADLKVISDNEVLLTISEGKFHQVKRMFKQRNNRVISLHRESIGNIALDPALEPGQYRALTQTEIESI
ncbi:MAG: pseudouridine synthase [Pseudomonadales bacterium]